MSNTSRKKHREANCDTGLRRQRRRGFTLVEVVIAAAASTMLMGGLAAALFMSTQALTPDSASSTDANRAALILGQLASEVRHALRFSERSATAVTFDVPDRNGDAKPETIRYAWSGVAGAPLTCQYNGGTAATVAGNVQSFNVNAIVHPMAGEATDVPAAASVSYDAFAEAKAGTDTTFLVVAAPSGTAAGKLLVAGLVVDGDEGNFFMAQGGWNRVARVDSTSDVGAAVWWKIAGPNEPNSFMFFWPTSHRAYGWIMRFTGASPTAPINAAAWRIGTSLTPTCPSVTTTVPNTTIVRMGGFNRGDVNVDAPGMSGTTTITMDRSDSSSSAVSGGATYATAATAGVVGSLNFTLTNNRDYATFTLAIAPNN